MNEAKAEREYWNSLGNGYIENAELDDFLTELLTMALPYSNCVQVHLHLSVYILQ